MHISDSSSGLDRRSRTLALSARNVSASSGRASASWANHLPRVLGDLLGVEAAEPVAGELAVIEPGLVVADHAGCDQHRGQRVLGAEALHSGGYVGAPGGVEQFVEAVEDHHGAAGQQQQIDQAGRGRTLVEGLQHVLDVADDRTFRRIRGRVVPQRHEERDRRPRVAARSGASARWRPWSCRRPGRRAGPTGRSVRPGRRRRTEAGPPSAVPDARSGERSSVMTVGT